VSQSRYSDLDRPPLRGNELRRALVSPDGLWSAVEVKDETGSTNADVAEAARQGAAEGLVVIAERQTAGRGRQGRQWSSPARAGLAVSVLLRPAGVPVSRYGWLPLLAGVALVETVRRLGEVDAVLKWPNDLLIDERKCAGILAESVPDVGVVLGFGVNVTLRQHELPVPEATSLALAGSACTDRAPLLRAVLRELAAWYVRWRDAGGAPDSSGLRAAYRLHCATIGRPVRVTLPGGAVLSADASDVDDDGRLVVTAPNGEVTALSAGDVRHLRAG
jgi:BirA family transcriptional regulator, biotin operon repressor / biotin---[acetyl-CoA-carboxylase] ligase